MASNSAAYMRDYRRKNPGAGRRRPETERKHQLKKKYGITLDEYAALLEMQGGVCAVCKKVCNTGRRLAVDHDHSNGNIRGLLCACCNTALGKFRDSPELLRAAIAYLNV